jgi:LemA protein
LTGAVGNLFAVAERYPTLKASQQFLLLQEQLTSTENRIAYARQYYNESVRRYNTALAEFPRNMLAGMMGFSAAALFEADEGDQALPQIVADERR